ncbi:MAG TPA: hypothetical protein PKE21_17245 [Flavobacteriales bacterium]|nr:hypothetical protein [Flavobacteriales bacterium]HMR29226.1 hypothetical protein [Flavobacteriales bacterium]
MRTGLLIYGLTAVVQVTLGQGTVDTVYTRAYNRILDMLEGRRQPSLKTAVLEVENAYFLGQLDTQAFSGAITRLATIAAAWANANRLTGYTAKDSTAFLRSGAVFHLMTDTVFGAPGIPLSLPFRYDTVDYFGWSDPTHMFVSRLLATHEGNCHSLPLLYAMLCHELGTKAYLAMAPMHMYIKQHSEQLGWYNTELTSATFPSDAWVMASGYVSTDAIRSGLYMDTLGLRKALALCLVDLAQGYQQRAAQADIGFVLRCCDLALAHYPACAQALLVKAAALGSREPPVDGPTMVPVTNPALEATLATLVNLGYREVPLEVYLAWMRALARDPQKYANPLMPPTTSDRP